jgi:DME family drug/metabolite transporter
MAVEPVVAAPPERVPSAPRDRLLGYAFGVVTALCWATSPILIKKGLNGLPSPTWGITVGMAAATVIVVAWVAVRRPAGVRLWGTAQGRASFRAPLLFLLIAGAVSGLGSLARTVAIDLAPVVVVLPLVQTASLFTVILAPLLLGRHVEHVPPRLLFGAALVVVGSGLVIVGLNR